MPAPNDTDAGAVGLVERLRNRVSIETACGNRTENPNNHVRLMDEAADIIDRLTNPAEPTITPEMIEAGINAKAACEYHGSGIRKQTAEVYRAMERERLAMTKGGGNVG